MMAARSGASKPRFSRHKRAWPVSGEAGSGAVVPVWRMRPGAAEAGAA